jgi:NO-binding membrane sensor protein with MHYT domain/two-component sensor histidine kinase
MTLPDDERQRMAQVSAKSGGGGAGRLTPRFPRHTVGASAPGTPPFCATYRLAPSRTARSDDRAGFVHHDHLAIFAVLSVVVAVFGSWTALDLFRRVRGHGGGERRVWLLIAAVAMGSSIWSMHFIAMLGFDPGSPVSFDLGLTALSLVLAVGGTGAAFLVAAGAQGGGEGGWGRLALAGLTMGLSIGVMHYVGMAAVRTAVGLAYEPLTVAASLLVAVGAATAALLAARRDHSAVWRAAAALVLGLAIVGMHYTAMAAVRLTAEPAAAGGTGASPLALAAAVAAGTILILILAIGAALHDQRNSVLLALDAGGAGYWELTLPDRGLIASPGAKALLGLAADRPVTQADVEARLVPETQEARARALEAAIAGQADYDMEYALTDGRWVQVRGRLFRGRGGRPLKLAGVILDVTDRHRAHDDLAASHRRQQLLMNELNHRVKNTLATIQAIASATARQSPDLPAFKERFEARLIALSRTHNLLNAQGWDGADLRQLLEQELSPYPADQVTLDGPPVALRPEDGLALGLVFHELVTNAAKYGALSRTGSLDVGWTEGPDGEVALTWTERGGPPVAGPPSREGFGSRLIRMNIETALKGTAEMDYAPEGLTARLRFRRRA